MIIYNPHNNTLINERLSEAENILKEIPAKYCFITGSFLFKQKFNDVDVFVVSRTKKQINIKNKKVNIKIIDFNELYSLFYHSVSKSCIAKNILPKRPLKVTISDYWSVINEAVPTLLNQKNKFHKSVRFLVLYCEYFRTGEVLDSFQLSEKINQFADYEEILEYLKKEVPSAINSATTPGYVKRFFYTQAGHYKELKKYSAQKFLYNLAHQITRGITPG